MPQTESARDGGGSPQRSWLQRGLLLRVGGVPIDRRRAGGFIDAAVQ